jgi:hypothetical protein
VQQSYRTFIGIDQIDRNTVSDGNGEQDARLGSSVAVRSSLCITHRFSVHPMGAVSAALLDATSDPVMNENRGPMDLPGMHNGLEPGSPE